MRPAGRYTAAKDLGKSTGQVTEDVETPALAPKEAREEKFLAFAKP